MNAKPTSIALVEDKLPIATNLTVVRHVDSRSSEADHVNADAAIMTTQIAHLMNVWPHVETLDDMCQLSNQLMKTLKVRRELCLKPASKKEVTDDDKEIDITPI